MTTPRCLSCKHCIIDFGSRGYSEMTPGSPGIWSCDKNVWGFEEDTRDCKDVVAAAFAAGETCKLWEDDGRRQIEASDS